MHITPYDNGNKPIVDAENSTVPLNYFNIVKLKKGEAFTYRVPGYETVSYTHLTLPTTPYV